MKIESPNVRSEINVTPLVDVVLVLLIIFMVVTPMLQKGQAVRLPVTNNPEKKADDKNQVLVAINADKKIWVDKEVTLEAQFDAKIKEVFDRNPGSTIMVKADSRLTFGDVKKLVFKIRDAGFTRVGLITEKRSQT
jgi:biopolymer transport protein TolR